MAYIPKNFELLGIFLLLAAAGSRTSGLQVLGKAGILTDFARDMHRAVNMMDQVSAMGQLAVPRDTSHVGGAARAFSSALSGAQGSTMPDLTQLMEMAGPLMSLLGTPDGSLKK